MYITLDIDKVAKQLKAKNAGEIASDLYADVASELNDKPVSEVTLAERLKAKRWIYNRVYNISTLAKG